MVGFFRRMANLLGFGSAAPSYNGYEAGGRGQNLAPIASANLPALIPPKPTLPHSLRLYAIGDIHGRLDLLHVLLDSIEKDMTTLPAGFESGLIFLGDYIDRGSASYGVIDHLLAGQLPGTRAPIFLRGNHEQAMLQFLEDVSIGPLWLQHGGREALMSYGVVPPVGQLRPEHLPALQEQLHAKLPASHRNFLDNTQLYYEAGDYLFVHAGVRPGLPFLQQHPHDLMNIREPFLSTPHHCGKLVVHGHSIDMEVRKTPYRIGIDTGAYASGILTALVLEGPQQRTLQTISFA